VTARQRYWTSVVATAAVLFTLIWVVTPVLVIAVAP